MILMKAEAYSSISRVTGTFIVRGPKSTCSKKKNDFPPISISFSMKISDRENIENVARQRHNI